MDIADKGIVLTRRGYDDMRRELDEIMTVKRPAVVNRIREARQLGDLKENFDYQDAKQVQGMLEARVRELEAVLSRATVFDCPEENGCVSIGSKVVVKDLEDGSQEEYWLVGSAESSPAEGKISHESSVGSALMGQKAGDIVTAQTPGGTVQFEIICIE